MRRWFLSLFVCLALLLGVRMAKAANIGLENVAGGAAISYWTCADGFETLINIQNTSPNAIAVHLVFYDQNSQEIVDFNVFLSGYDNWGAPIRCNNGQLIISPEEAGEAGPVIPPSPIGDTVEGYVTAAITAIDGDCDGNGVIDPPGPPAPLCRNGSAQDEVTNANANYGRTTTGVRIPNWIILRSAIVNTSAGNAFALNSFALVNFLNLPAGYSCFNGIPSQAGSLPNSPEDDVNGVRIGLCELGAENVGVPVPLPPAGRLTFVVGSPNGTYWARFGNNDVVDTSLVLIFPAMGGGNSLDMTVFDDNENGISQYFRAGEVAHIRMGTDITAWEHGEVLINVRRSKDWDNDGTPDRIRPAFFGFSLVEGVAGTFVDIYPIVRSGFAYCDATGCGTF